MKIQTQILQFINSLSAAKATDLLALHTLMLQLMPDCKLWLLDGKNDAGKVVANPNIGYGSYTIKYADGSTKEFYQIGLSPNTTGISVYIFGIDDKMFLKNTFTQSIGKATVTGYCIKFKKLSDVHINILQEAIMQGIACSCK
jgi:hypothetical protein